MFSRISFYNVASTPDAAFIIGGWDPDPVTTVAKFENDEWSLYGNLQQGRLYHGAISFGEMSMVVGGWTDGAE